MRRCEMKGQPCRIMCSVKFRWPSRDGSLRSEQFGLSSRVDATRIILLIFSLGNETWNFTVSKSMPKNLTDVTGPLVLF